MSGRAAEEPPEVAVALDELADLRRLLERLREERDYLLVHSQNLEAELRQRAREATAVRDLEARLADAEARLRRVSVVQTARWLLLEPDAALRRISRRLRESIGWRVRERYRILRLRLRRSRA